jgi:hypothetical protein
VKWRAGQFFTAFFPNFYELLFLAQGELSPWLFNVETAVLITLQTCAFAGTVACVCWRQAFYVQ